jgi:hypothetical protein
LNEEVGELRGAFQLIISELREQMVLQDRYTEDLERANLELVEIIVDSVPYIAQQLEAYIKQTGQQDKEEFRVPKKLGDLFNRYSSVINAHLAIYKSGDTDARATAGVGG